MRLVEEVEEEVKTPAKETASSEEDRKSQKAQYRKTYRNCSMNDTHPLWTKHPNECTEEEYIDFYRKVFMDYKEPLFWIHLNMDYPFNLKGILILPEDQYGI